MFSRSAALAWAPDTLTSTVFRTRPKKSGVHDASNGSANSANVPLATEVAALVAWDAPGVAAVELVAPTNGTCAAVIEGATAAWGKYCDLACFTRERAARKFAIAFAMF